MTDVESTVPSKQNEQKISHSAKRRAEEWSLIYFFENEPYFLSFYLEKLKP